jgi:hypothetical protein
MSDLFADMDVISVYTVDDGIQDGMLVKVLEHRWPELSGGKPIIMTSHIANEFSMAGVMEMWNEYVMWNRESKPYLPAEDQMFATKMNNQTVWIIEDGAAHTIMFPEDY